MTSRRRRTEADVAARVRAHFEALGAEVWAEVRVRHDGPRADLVVRETIEPGGPAEFLRDRWTVVEAKVAIGLDVLRQVDRWRGVRRLVAVGGTRNLWGEEAEFASRIARAINVGIVVVPESPLLPLRWLAWPAPVVPESIGHDGARELAEVVSDRHKTAKPAGTPGGGFATAWTGTIEALRDAVRESPGRTVREIVESGLAHHYASDEVAVRVLSDQVRKGTARGFRTRGIGKRTRLFLAEEEEAPAP